MSSLLRIFLLLLVVWLLVAGLNMPGLILLGFYLLYFTGYELVVAVFLVDVYHGALLGWPWFTCVVAIATLAVDLLKPRVLLYTGKNETFS